MSDDLCSAPLHPFARRGLELFNAGEYFEAHEALEDAWRDDRSEIRLLYQGILQAAVVYLHISNNNYPGATRLYERCKKLLDPWPDTCRGVEVADLRHNLSTVMEEVTRLGPEELHKFNTSLFKPVKWE
jgi:uncharacterized protein